MSARCYFVYIVANATRVLYTGMTAKLDTRMAEHQEKIHDGFTSHFHHCRLVYYESFDDVRNAIDREKQIKRWRRNKKIFLIEQMNPNWHDLGIKTKIKGIAPRLTASAARSG